MNHYLFANLKLFPAVVLLLAFPTNVLASEGDQGGGLEVEVNGYHVTLLSQNGWIKGDDILTVTITDSMGMPVSGAEVGILLTPRENGHDESEADAHGTSQDSAPGVDVGNEHPTESTAHGMDMDAHATEAPAISEHGDEEIVSPLAMTESEHGTYTVETHFESSGEYDAHIMFHVNGELMQADFVAQVSGASSKTILLWSYAAVNVVIVAVAGMMKKQKTSP